MDKKEKQRTLGVGLFNTRWKYNIILWWILEFTPQSKKPCKIPENKHNKCEQKFRNNNGMRAKS